MQETAIYDLTALPAPAQTEAVFADTIHMCSKCCRKLGDAGKALRKAVKAALRDEYGDVVKVEKTDCFSLCPKGGQVAAAYSKRRGRRLVVLEPDSDVELAVEYLVQASR
jgi:predicted metal-binding protein